MTQQAPRLDLSTAPYVPQTLTTSRVMFEVLAALVPIVAAAVWFFGVTALLMVVVAGVVAMATEWLFSDRKGWGSLRDGTALLTGVLVALTLPPALPLWMVVIGSAVAIALGKLVLGGMGHNLFNPRSSVARSCKRPSPRPSRHGRHRVRASGIWSPARLRRR